ncbi:hypothetical protein F5J12DRAFT_783848 [Pisolithus orientalis]|uniref:uncharacterized protein n=1 Tax=Pisolithus orientalis TaxID=936130 RepID=UPI002225344E|nr:uncharacterized protein F5J12DRAFT_783848 [Pisolithus orientalis]KAI6002369.1 hypothetical protein F5J12DRAFT_783848 [Pisolithus orientalis]
MCMISYHMIIDTQNHLATSAALTQPPNMNKSARTCNCSCAIVWDVGHIAALLTYPSNMCLTMNMTGCPLTKNASVTDHSHKTTWEYVCPAENHKLCRWVWNVRGDVSKLWQVGKYAPATDEAMRYQTVQGKKSTKQQMESYLFNIVVTTKCPFVCGRVYSEACECMSRTHNEACESMSRAHNSGYPHTCTTWDQHMQAGDYSLCVVWNYITFTSHEIILGGLAGKGQKFRFGVSWSLQYLCLIFLVFLIFICLCHFLVLMSHLQYSSSQCCLCDTWSSPWKLP